MKLQGNAYVSVVCLTVGLGGFLFGFDTAVISGAINFLRIQFHLSAGMEGWLMSSALLGCVLGAAIAGFLADRYGRKKILLLSALLFMVSSLDSALVGNVNELIMARIIGGIGVGFAAMVAPLFISELAPARLRGRLVSLYQLAITFGILCSYLSNSFLLTFAGTSNIHGAFFLDFYLHTQVWRGMLGSNMIPALLFFIFLIFVPESPRWLVKVGKLAEAGRILERINGKGAALTELYEIRSAIACENGEVRELLLPAMRIALIIGLALPFLSQLTGITTVMYYAPAIFEKAGLEAGNAMGSASEIGFFNMIFTLIAIWKIDQWGRKPLLIWGFTGLGVALLLIGWSFNHPSAGNSFILLSFILYIALFAATLGPGVWVLISEIYPTKIRGRAMSLGTLSLFMGSMVITQTYPLLRDSVGIGNVFIIYGCIMFPAAFFVLRLVPETKGKTLESIEDFWKEKKMKTSLEQNSPGFNFKKLP